MREMALHRLGPPMGEAIYFEMNIITGMCAIYSYSDGRDADNHSAHWADVAYNNYFLVRPQGALNRSANTHHTHLGSVSILGKIGFSCVQRAAQVPRRTQCVEKSIAPPPEFGIYFGCRCV